MPGRVTEIPAAAEAKRADIRLMRFTKPEPQRIIGLAWRKTSPRKRDFATLADLIMEAAGACADLAHRPGAAPHTQSKKHRAP